MTETGVVPTFMGTMGKDIDLDACFGIDIMAYLDFSLGWAVEQKSLFPVDVHCHPEM